MVLLRSASCLARAPRPARFPEGRPPPRIEYSVQVGAFASPDNALGLVEALAGRGLEAFYFAGADGLHKVRFGSFASRELALGRATDESRPEAPGSRGLRRGCPRGPIDGPGTPWLT